MELIGFDTCRIIHLQQWHRSSGQVYLPEATAKLVQRYSFAKHPSLDELQKDTHTFALGKFRDVQISEFSVYNDGVIVASRCNTQFLESFLDDLFEWMAKEFDVVPISNIKFEWHVESAIVVRSKSDLAKIVSPQKAALELIKSTLCADSDFHFHPSGTLIDCDPAEVKTRRKPMRFLIERKVGSQNSENIFYCQAPLTTLDHLALLQELENL